MSIEIHTIFSGTIGSDAGVAFGVIPKVMWQKWVEPSADNKITMALRNLYVEDGDRKIIVDTGIGNYYADDPKFLKFHRPDRTNFDYAQALAPFNTSPEQITDVLLTHMHYDHVGGIIVKKNDTFAPTFPNAKVWLQNEQWAWAQNPTIRDKAGYHPRQIDAVKQMDQLELIEGDQQISDNMSVLCFHGHTPAMQCPLIKNGSSTYFYAADLVPRVQHIHLPCIMSVDLYPLTTLAEKETLFPKAIEEDWTIIMQHDPDVEACKIKYENNRFSFIDCSG